MPFCDLPEEELEALRLEEQQRNAMPASTCGGDGSCSSTAGSCKTQGGASAVRSGAAGNAKGMCHSEGSWGNTKLTWSTGKADGPRIRGAGERRPDQCFKCRVSKPIVAVRMKEPLCLDCLEAGVIAKVKALKQNHGIVPGEKVVVAMSGGSCSLALLHCARQFQAASTQRQERGKVAFDLTAVHIDESCAYGLDTQQSSQHAVKLQASMHSVGLSQQALVIVPIEAAFAESAGVGSLNSAAQGPGQHGADAGTDAAEQWQQPGASPRSAAEAAACLTSSNSVDTGGCSTSMPELRTQMQALMKAVPDITGKEDLISHLRMQLLIATARKLGASKLLLGCTADTLAVSVLASVSKGRGYALPGDLHVADGRAGPEGPVVLQPFREVSSKECAFLCHAKQMPLAVLPYVSQHAKRSINQLAFTMLSGLQAGLPSTVYTVIKSACALKPFAWNDAASVLRPEQSTTSKPGQDSVPQSKTQEVLQLATGSSKPAQAPAAASANTVVLEVPGCSSSSSSGVPLCGLCRAPLSERDLAMALAASRAHANSLDAEFDDDGGDDHHADADADSCMGGSLGALARACLCCRQQILGGTFGASVRADSAQGVLKLLPAGLL